MPQQKNVALANAKKTYWWRKNPPTPCIKSKQAMPGDICAYCQKGILEFDGSLNIICNRCGTISDCAAST